MADERQLRLRAGGPAGRRVLLWGTVAAIAGAASGCSEYRFGYRHFAELIEPRPVSSALFRVGDDRSVTYVHERLEITLQPVTTEMLDRQFGGEAPVAAGRYENPYARDTNPYTYGQWRPPEGGQTPERFTVFSLRVKNYEYPKVLVDPAQIRLEADNGRGYESLPMLALLEYFWPYAVAYSGNTYLDFKERTDLLRHTLYPSEFVFSGQEKHGFLVFPPVHRDVEEFTVSLDGVGVRFDFRDEPVESLDVRFQFRREVYLARRPRGG